MIRVRNFSKSYGDFAAVRDLSFDVGPGDILGLVGSNGAGKSTTLRALSGIVGPTSGNLEIAGHDIVREPIQAKQCLGYIPDDPRLFDTLTVWEHLAFSAAAYRVEDFDDKAEALLDAFDLAKRRDSLAHDLSRGMRQKVAIACAFLHDPRALLFDEPLTGLDPQGIRDIQRAMRERARDGAAIIISSHLLSLVENLCSHVLVLAEGECRRFGTMSDVLRDVRETHGDGDLEAAFFAITADRQTEAAE
jgi:ABC-2 type transport system ATP-binding protein